MQNWPISNIKIFKRVVNFKEVLHAMKVTQLRDLRALQVTTSDKNCES